MASNKKNGNDFEKWLAGYLFLNGYWVHILKDNKNGQPFDLIAARDGAHAIDAKECRNDYFDLNRIEDNQKRSMELWQDRGNGPGWFALKWSDDSVTMITLDSLKAWDGSRITKFMAEKIGVNLEDWAK